MLRTPSATVAGSPVSLGGSSSSRLRHQCSRALHVQQPPGACIVLRLELRLHDPGRRRTGLAIERPDVNAHLLRFTVADQVEKLLAAGQKLRVVMIRLPGFLVHLRHQRRSPARRRNPLQSRPLIPEHNHSVLIPRPAPGETLASHKVVGEPPATSIRFNFPPATNASDLLSGDQNGRPASAVPGSARATSDSSGRT